MTEKKNPWLVEVLFDWLDTALEFIAALGYRPDWYLDEYARAGRESKPDVVTFAPAQGAVPDHRIAHTGSGEAVHLVPDGRGRSLCGIVPVTGWFTDRASGMRLCKWCARERDREQDGAR